MENIQGSQTPHSLQSSEVTDNHTNKHVITNCFKFDERQEQDRAR